jgi:hypothetical protein
LKRGNPSESPTEIKEVFMITFELEATVTEDGNLIIPVPADIQPGLHKVVVVIEANRQPKRKSAKLDLPVHDTGFIDPNFTASREQIYEDADR